MRHVYEFSRETKYHCLKTIWNKPSCLSCKLFFKKRSRGESFKVLESSVSAETYPSDWSGGKKKLTEALWILKGYRKRVYQRSFHTSPMYKDVLRWLETIKDRLSQAMNYQMTTWLKGYRFCFTFRISRMTALSNSSENMRGADAGNHASNMAVRRSDKHGGNLTTAVLFEEEYDIGLR